MPQAPVAAKHSTVHDPVCYDSPPRVKKLSPQMPMVSRLRNPASLAGAATACQSEGEGTQILILNETRVKILCGQF